MDDSVSAPLERLAHIERLLEALGGVVWEFDWSTGSFTYVNGAAERLLGFSHEEWLAPGFWLDRMHPEDAGWAPKYCMDATRSGEDHEFEYRLIHKDGREVWVYDLVTVDVEKRMEGALRGVIIDITQRKTAEADALRKAEEFESALRIMRDLYLRVAPDGTVLEVQAPAGLLSGEDVRAGEVKRLSDIFTHDTARSVEHAVETARESGAMVLSEYETFDTSGPRSWEARYLPMESGEVVVLSRDVTDRYDAEKRLKRAQERYQTLVEMSPYAIIVTSLDGRVRYCNAATDSMLGACEDKPLVGRSLTALIDSAPGLNEGEADIHRVEAEMRTWRPGTPSPASGASRCAIRTLTGATIGVERSVAGIVFRNEPSLLTLAREVTDELEAERLTRESEARFRNLVEHAPFGVHMYEMRGDDLVFAGANPIADHIIGLGHRTLLGRTITEAFPGLEDTDIPEAYRRAALEGTPFHADQVDYEDRQISGAFEVSAFQTSPGNIAVVFADITERAKAERALLDSKHRLQEAQQMARMGHYVFDILEDRWMSSAGLDTVFGIDAEFARDFAGWVYLLHPEDRDATRSYFIEDVAKAGHGFDREYRIVRPSDGETRWIHGLGQLDFDADGKAVKMFGTMQDITDRRVAEERERRYTERLSTMAADLTVTEERERRRLAEELHERVSQTLAAALMHLKTASADPAGCSSVSAMEMAKLLDRAVSEVRAITTELAPPILFEIGLGAALQWQCDDLAELHGLRCHLSVDTDESGVSDDAKTLLFRAARELLVNVVKHSGTSAAWISLDLLPGWLELTVADEGKGFDVDAGLRAGGHSGFGLFSIRDRLPHLGGEFEIDSSPDNGTRVSLRVPRAAG